MLALTLIIFLFSSPLALLRVSASSGDRSSVFQSCVQHCSSEPCILSLPLRLTRWTCEDECKYTCMHSITSRVQERVEQYYGKWPFWRFVGMQEPASVLFSLMNFYAHYRGYYSLRQYVRLENPMKDYYRVWSLVNMNAWIWSSVFHTRDTPFTEKMDYFSAGFAILYSLFYTVLRLFHLYSRSPYLIPWLLLCLTLYISHISYLSLSPRFDYSYNILANLIIGLIHNALWVIFAIPNSPLHRPNTITPA